VAVLTPALGSLSEARQQLFLFTLTLLERFRGEGLDAAADADVAAAANALGSTFETESRGVIYEHRANSVPAQRMADGMKGVFDQLGRGRPTGFAADAAAVLRQLEDRVRAVQLLHPADPRAFLDVAGRMAKRVGGPGAQASVDEGAPAPERGGPSIILP
jgi:hypothetical protein